MVRRQRTQPALIGRARIGVDLHQSLIATQARRTGAALAPNLSMVEIGITSIEQPATVVLLNRDASMSPGMAGERDQQDLRWQAFQITDRVKPEPAFSPA